MPELTVSWSRQWYPMRANDVAPITSHDINSVGRVVASTVINAAATKSSISP